MYNTSTEIKVGLFVIVALALFIWMAVRLGGFSWTQAGTYDLSTVFSTAGGLKQGVSVEVAGIQVGTVARIELFENKEALVTMAIREGVILPLDSEAHIRASGILGDKFVELVPGANSREDLTGGDRITTAKSAPEIADVLGQIGSIATDIKTITGPMAQGNTGADIRDMVSNFKAMSLRLDNLVSSNEAGLTAAIVGLQASMANLQEITTKINSGEGTLGQLINSDSAANEIHTSLASIRSITHKIDSGDGTIGRLINDETTVDKIDKTLSSINGYFEKEAKFQVFVDYQASYQTRHDYMKSTVNIRLQPAPDRYYLLGVTSDYFGKYKRTDRRFTDNNGNVSTSISEEWRRDKLKLNAQIARRYYDLVVRGGLIESGAGVGFDYYLDDDNLRLTFEVFSSDFDYNPHLRAEASYNIWKIFYVSLGYDDFISDRHRASPYFGIGIQFNDNDLKTLLSGAASAL